MANINVVSLAGAKVGEFELAELFSQDVNDALLWGVGKALPRCSAAGNCRDQDA